MAVPTVTAAASPAPAAAQAARLTLPPLPQPPLTLKDLIYPLSGRLAKLNTEICLLGILISELPADGRIQIDHELLEHTLKIVNLRDQLIGLLKESLGVTEVTTLPRVHRVIQSSAIRLHLKLLVCQSELAFHVEKRIGLSNYQTPPPFLTTLLLTDIPGPDCVGRDFVELFDPLSGRLVELFKQVTNFSDLLYFPMDCTREERLGIEADKLVGLHNQVLMTEKCGILIPECVQCPQILEIFLDAIGKLRQNLHERQKAFTQRALLLATPPVKPTPPLPKSEKAAMRFEDFTPIFCLGHSSKTATAEHKLHADKTTLKPPKPPILVQLCQIANAALKLNNKSAQISELARIIAKAFTNGLKQLPVAICTPIYQLYDVVLDAKQQAQLQKELGIEKPLANLDKLHRYFANLKSH